LLIFLAVSVSISVKKRTGDENLAWSTGSTGAGCCDNKLLQECHVQRLLSVVSLSISSHWIPNNFVYRLLTTEE
jgi:hypothetical protein